MNDVPLGRIDLYCTACQRNFEIPRDAKDEDALVCSHCGKELGTVRTARERYQTMKDLFG